MKVKRMVTIAMLIAMYVVLSLFSINLGNMKITLDSLPIIVGAALLGPLGGFLIGFIGSFLNQLLTFGLTATTLLWVLPSAVRGLLVGLYAKHCRFHMNFWQTQMITISTALLVTALNTVVMYLDSKIYGYYSFAYVFGAVVPRIFTGVLTAFIFGSILPLILGPVQKIIGTNVRESEESN